MCTIKKTLLENYELRHNGEYASITLKYNNNNAGEIQISSSFGNWANYWPACGENFKDFLCSLDFDYLANKLRVEKILDIDATYKNLINSVELNTYPNEEQRQILLDELKELFELTSDKSSLLHFFYDNTILVNFFETIDYHEMVSPQFRLFFDSLWKSFIEYLKNEIKDIDGN